MALNSLGAPAALASPPASRQPAAPADVTPEINFSASQYRDSELSASAPLTVTLSPASAVTATVDYAASLGSAQAGDDYSAISGTLTFSPGITSQTINLPLLDDGLTEGDETLTITLTSPVSATLGLTATALLAITDDETTAFTVTKGDDTNDGACETTDCSLREAVIAANAYSGANSIDLPTGTYTLSLAGANENAAATGDLDVTGDLTLGGVTSATTVITTTGSAFEDRLFEITSTVIVSITNLKLTGGHITGLPVGTNGGGALYNWGQLKLADVLLTGNFAHEGGALGNTGLITLERTLVYSNTSYEGGGLHNQARALATAANAFILDSTFASNVAPDGGGAGIFSAPTGILTVTNTAFISNTTQGGTGKGGGIASYGELAVSDSSFEENYGHWGGGLHIEGAAVISRSLITNNDAPQYGGGINVFVDVAPTSTVMITGSEISHNAALSGGGLYGQGLITITNSSWLSNTATTQGGGVYAYIGQQMRIENSQFMQNHAGTGGGIWSQARLEVIDTDILSNTAVTAGAGIYNYNFGHLTLTAASLISNTAGGHGGGILNTSALSVMDSTFLDNISAIGSGGGIRNDGQLVVSNTLFISNRSSIKGGGIAAYEPAQVFSSTFSFNQSFEGGGFSNGTGIGQPGSTVTGSQFDYNIGKQGGGLQSGGNITITNSTFTNNVATICGGGIEVWPITVITASTFLSNIAPKGGGICGTGQVWLYDSLVMSNTASGHGGGILVEQLLYMERSTISGNVAGTDGGGIYSPNGGLWLSDSVVSNNAASGVASGTGNGGGILVTQFMIAINSTVSGNTATGDGGGLYSGGYTSFFRTNILNNLTIANNTADQDDNGTGDGGGVFVAVTSTLQLTNTLIAENHDLSGQAPDCAGTVTSSGYNLIESTLGCTVSGTTTGNVTGQAALLGPLADNFGPTWTHALLAGSPAVDGGSPAAPGSGGTACETADQRGILRPQGAACDIGAYELVITPTVQFSSAVYSAHEHSAVAAIAVKLNVPSLLTVTVGYSTTDGTALAGQDYLAAGAVLTFTPGQTTQVFTITLLPDGLADPGENLSVTLSGPANAMLGTLADAELTLSDAQVQLGSTAANIGEAGSAAILPVLLDVAAGYTLTVTYDVSDGTALAGSDYLVNGGTLTFTPGLTQTLLSVPIVADNLHEPSESFEAALLSSAGATLAAALTATITIEDDDAPPGVRFSTSPYTVTESAGSAILTVTLTAASDLTATVLFTTSPGTAQAGDYVQTSGTLTFTPGLTETAVAIPILPDSLHEAAEAFSVALGNPIAAVLAAPPTTTVTLQDDDPVPEVSFSSSEYSLTEIAGSAVITVSLSTPSGLTATVHFGTAPGSAGAGIDYIHTSGTLTFAAGITQTTALVPIQPDSLYEGPESFALVLSSPSGAILAAPSTATVAIVDDDAAPAISFSSSAYSAAEGAGPAIITVTLSAPSGVTATVVYSASSGTALAGSDFTPASGTLTFAPGQQQQTFTIAITDDTALEAAETILLQLFAPGAAALGVPASAMLTIQDNEVEHRILLPFVDRS